MHCSRLGSAKVFGASNPYIRTAERGRWIDRADVDTIIVDGDKAKKEGAKGPYACHHEDRVRSRELSVVVDCRLLGEAAEFTLFMDKTGPR